MSGIGNRACRFGPVAVNPRDAPAALCLCTARPCAGGLPPMCRPGAAPPPPGANERPNNQTAPRRAARPAPDQREGAPKLARPLGPPARRSTVRHSPAGPPHQPPPSRSARTAHSAHDQRTPGSGNQPQATRQHGKSWCAVKPSCMRSPVRRRLRGHYISSAHAIPSEHVEDETVRAAEAPKEARLRRQ